MKKFIITSFLVISGCLSLAQTYLIQVKPVGSKFWKYANLTGEIVIDCQYPRTYPFSKDGLAAEYFPQNNTYVIINTRGEELSTEISKYHLIEIFGYGAKGYSEGLLAVMIKDKWGYMDVTGRIVVPLKYDHLTEFNDGCGVAILKDQFFLIDRNGNETPVEGEPDDVKQFTENLAPFFSKKERWGFINTSGKIVILPQFLSVGNFYNGKTRARNSNNLIGLINEKGEWILDPAYNVIKDFDKVSGLARAKKGDSWFYINENGEEFTFDISEISDDFREGLARGRKGELFGFFNNKGEWVIEPQFQDTRDFKNGYAGAKSGDLWGLIDKKGNWIIKPSFAGITDVMIVD
jgi:hypothetical protein